MLFELTNQDFQLLMLMCRRSKEIFTQIEDIERVGMLEKMFTYEYQQAKQREKK